MSKSIQNIIAHGQLDRQIDRTSQARDYFMHFMQSKYKRFTVF